MHSIHGISLIFIISNVILSIQGASIITDPPKSIYSKLLDYTSKCPYLNKTKLLEPEPAFLKSCANYNAITTIRYFNETTAILIPCLFYYNNFYLLCSINEQSELSKLINSTKIDKYTASIDLKKVCDELKGVSKLAPDVQVAVGSVLPDFKKGQACEKICSDIYGEKKPICNLAAYMLSVFKSMEYVTEHKKQKPEAEPVSDTDNAVAPAVPPAAALAVPAAAAAPAVPPAAADLAEAVKKKPKTTEEQSGIIEHEDNSEKSGVSADSKSNVASNKEPVETSLQSHNTSQTEIKKHSDTLNMPINVPQDVSKTAPKAALMSKPAEDENVQPKPAAKADLKPESDNDNKAVGESPQEDKKTDDSPQQPVQDVKKDEIESEINLDDSPDAAGNPPDDNENLPDSNDEEVQNDEDNNKEDGKVKANAKPGTLNEDGPIVDSISTSNSDEEDSFFFIYFMMVCAVFILGYIGYHNKQKVLALVIEGRRGRRDSRRGRPNSANYHKLDSNLEEAVTSSCNKNTTNIIY